MNTMGKILVFLNLVFALVFLGFLVFYVRTVPNWKQQYEAAKTQLSIAQINSEELQKTNRDINQKLKQEEQKRLQTQKDYQAMLTKKDQEIAQIKADVAKAGLLKDKADLARIAIQAELDRLRDEVKFLAEVKAKREGTILALNAKNDELLQQAQQALNDRDSVLNRNQNLVKQLRELHLKLAKSSASAKDAGKGRRPNESNPPPFYIKGEVVKVLSTDKTLIEVSLGSDHGIEVGQTLDAFRLRPAQYLGMVRIVTVEPRRSVARVLPSQGAVGGTPELRVGDEVASDIQGR